MRYLFGLLMSALLLFSCGGEPGSSSEAPADQNATVAEKARAASAQTTASDAGLPAEAKNGNFLPPVAPEEGSSMARILTQGYWIFEFYVADDPSARQKNKGRWFRFFADGTYESGHWEEKTGYGSWTLQNIPTEGLMLNLDNVDDAQDTQWEIQGVNQAEDTMTWAGISETKNAGVITKVINLLTQPTKKQFGIEE